MKTLKQIYLEYETVNEPDSMWNRKASAKKQANGKTAQQKLGIEDQGMESVFTKKVLSVMDVVNQVWNGETLSKTLEVGDEEEENGS